MAQVSGSIMIVGEHGMVGSALKRYIYDNTPELKLIPTPRKEALNFCNQAETQNFITKNKPDFLILAAAKVGGIQANNQHKADFLTENLLIQTNVIQSAYKAGVKKLLFIGSSCIYPKKAPQPMREDMLLTGALEPTNDAYAIAKLAGIKMCEAYRSQYGANFISCLPTNLYGPGDQYSLLYSHVIPALILKFHRAQSDRLSSVEVWGTGKPLRDFLYVDDLAEALICLLKNYNKPEPINIGSGQDISIKQVALKIVSITGYEGQIIFNDTYPDGAMRKSLDISKIEELGWRPKTTLDEGLIKAYDDFKGQAFATTSAA